MSISHTEHIAWLKQFGSNTNAFMTLYPGFEIFTDPNQQYPGLIAYANLENVWIAATEPLAQEEHLTSFFNSFQQQAQLQGKSTVFLPVRASIAQKALSQGFQSLLIGSEPLFDLQRFPPTGKTWLNIVPTAENLLQKGAQVYEFNPQKDPPSLKENFNQITKEWLESRLMTPLGFLNQVRPWIFSEYKRYFYCSFNQKILATLTAIPIWPRQGWYLIDLCKTQKATAGCTELLILQTLKKLQQSGAKIASLGVSPLAQLEQAAHLPLAHASDYPTIYRLLRFLYHQGGGFYRFKTLFHYKLKFQPSFFEPVFLIFNSHPKKSWIFFSSPSKPTITLKTLECIFQALTQKNLLQMLFIVFQRRFVHLKLQPWIESFFNTHWITRSAPTSRLHWIYRCKLTIFLALIHVIVFLSSIDLSSLTLPLSFAHTWAFSWDHFMKSPLNTLLFSPFLHWNLLHFSTNFLLLIFGVGLLECYLGTTMTFICFTISLLLANPITVLTLHIAVPLPLISPTEPDLGSSLGIFGCLGALSSLFKKTWVLIGILSFLVLMITLFTQQWLQLNHLFALLIGIIFLKTIR